MTGEHVTGPAYRIRGWRSLLFLALCAAWLAPARAQVIVSEFVASNQSGLRDEDGERSDWIELQNLSTNRVDLAGWRLTDDAAQPSKWVFPSIALAPGEFLVVFASGKNRAVAGRELHTSFRLDAQGEDLFLRRPDGSIASGFSPYPPQLPDVAYGVGRNSVQVTNLVALDAQATFQVATEESPGPEWREPAFDDVTWQRGPMPLGIDVAGSLGTYEQLVLADDPLFYWNFDESSGPALNRAAPGQIQDALVASGGAARVEHTALPLGRAASLPGTDGSRFYAPKLSPGADVRGSWAAEFWLRTSSPAKPTYFIEVATVGGTLNSPGLIQGFNGDRLEIFGAFAGRTGAAGPVLNTPGWHHLLFAYYGSAAGEGVADRQEIFVDGARVSSRSGDFSSPLVFGTGGLAAGGTIAGPGLNVLKGEMDELAIYDLRRFTNASLLSSHVASLAARHYQAVATTNLAGTFGTDLRSAMAGRSTSVLTRFPLVLSEATNMNHLTLAVGYDDGFAAWINGVPVAAANAPPQPGSTAAALTNRAPREALTPQVFDLDAFVPLLRPGTNVLAIQGLASAKDAPDFFLSAQLAGLMSTEQTGYLVPTPGTANGAASQREGPVVSDVTEDPPQPTPGQGLTIEATVAATAHPVAQVRLIYRIAFGQERILDLRDDGVAPDVMGGDGVYTAAIPGSAYAAGQMVRWAVVATDTASFSTRAPMAPAGSSASIYYGTVAADLSVRSNLPILQWFLEPGTEAAARTRAGTRACLFWDGEFYDNVWVHLRGRTAAGLDKCPYEFGFKETRSFRFARGEPRVDQFALNTTWRDKAYIRPVVGFEFLRECGVPASACFPMQVRRNGQFFSVALFVEIPDREYLRRHNLDAGGALYKADLNGFTVEAQGGYLPVEQGFEKKTPDDNDLGDIIEFARGLGLSGPARDAFVFDNVDIPAVINYMAACDILQHADRLVTNFYPYRDTRRSGEWTMLPWDLDLTLGQVNNSVDEIQTSQDNPDGASHPFYGIRGMADYRNPALWNRLNDVVVGTPVLRAMFLRRLRTLMDQFLCAPGTAAEQLYFEPRLNYWKDTLAEDAALDRSVWPTWGQNQTLAQAIGLIRDQYLPGRRQHLFGHHSARNPGYPNNAGIPDAQQEGSRLEFGVVETAPPSGDPLEQFIELRNPGLAAVDISGWKIAGAADFSFKPGTVVVAGGSVHVARDVRSFRARAVSPRGQEARFVQGNFSGALPASGELRLLSAIGAPVATLSYPAVADFDQDQLPDDWETAYGFDTNSMNNAPLDPDGDGSTNLQEYLAGTDPLDLESSLALRPAGNEPGAFFFLAVSNKTYSVEYRASLSTGAWLPLLDTPAWTSNSTRTVTDPTPRVESRYYRVRTTGNPLP